MSDSDELNYVSISELARQRGVNKAAISRRVARLEEQGLLTSRNANGRKLVNLAEFDRAAGQTVDAIREQNGKGASPAAVGAPGAALPGDPVLAREQARRASYEADLKRLDLDERLGLVVPIERVRSGATAAGHSIRRVLVQGSTRAEEMTAAVARDGVQGLRALLKAMLREQLAEMARALARIGEAEDDEAPAAEAEAEAAEA